MKSEVLDDDASIYTNPIEKDTEEVQFIWGLPSPCCVYCYCTVVFSVILSECWPGQGEPAASTGGDVDIFIVIYCDTYCTVKYTVVLLLHCFQGVDLDKDTLQRQLEEMLICWLLLYCCCTVISTVIVLLLCCFQDVDLDKESLRRQLEEMQRQAEAYKLQLQQKEQEAAAYKKKLDESIVTSEEA